MEKGKAPSKVDDVNVTSEGADPAAKDTGRKFELQNLDIVFPEGKLTLVTGPTASGKSALIVIRPLEYALEL